MGNENALTTYEQAGMIKHQPAGEGAMAVQSDRAVAEVLGAIQVAKQFPRDETEAMVRIQKACSRPALALQAMYAYPRGGETITGPSIRLMETLGQCWGNIQFGYVELDRSRSHTSGYAYAIDLETNLRVQRPFHVRHERKARGSVQPLTDPRDIYEHVANFAQRRVRACLMAVIPGDVVDQAVTLCNATANQKTEEPLADRVRKLVLAFVPMGVTREMLEKRQDKPVAEFNEGDLSDLRPIYTTLRDDQKDGDGSRVAEYFQHSQPQTQESTQESTQASRVKGAAKKATRRQAKKATERPQGDAQASEAEDAAEPANGDDTQTQAAESQPASIYDLLAGEIDATDHQNVLAKIHRQIEENVEVGALDAEDAAKLFDLLNAKRV